MLKAYQKAIIFENEKGIKTVITEGTKLNKIITNNGKIYTDVHILTLKNESMGVLCNEDIEYIDLWNIKDYE